MNELKNNKFSYLLGALGLLCSITVKAGCPGSEDEAPALAMPGPAWQQVSLQIGKDLQKGSTNQLSPFSDWPLPFKEYLPRLNKILRKAELPTLTLAELENTPSIASEYSNCGWEDTPSIGCIFAGLHDTVLTKLRISNR